MENAINSPTAQNLAHKSIIELANITYQNAVAAVEAKEYVDADATAAEAAKNAAAESATAAAGSATSAENAKTAAAASVNNARQAETMANEHERNARDAETNARNSATAAAGSADAAAASAAEAEAAMASKVDKTTRNNVVYATDDEGNLFPLNYGANHNPTPPGYGSIVYRTRAGYFNVLDATNNQHPAAYHQAKRFYHSVEAKNAINPGGDIDGRLTFQCFATSPGYYSSFYALAAGVIEGVFCGEYQPNSAELPITTCIIYAFSPTFWRVVFIASEYTSPIDFNPQTAVSGEFIDVPIIY